MWRDAAGDVRRGARATRSAPRSPACAGRERRADARGDRPHRRDRRRGHAHRGETGCSPSAPSAASTPDDARRPAGRDRRPRGRRSPASSAARCRAEERSERSRLEPRRTCTSTSARRDRDDAAALVRAGDAGVWQGEPLELPNGRFVSQGARQPARRLRRARGGAAASPRTGGVAGRRRRGRGGPGGDRPLRRARAAAFSLEPDGRDRDRRHLRDRRPGRGPARARAGSSSARARRSRAGPSSTARVSDLLVEAAEEEGIAHTFEVLVGPHAHRRRRRPRLARGRADRARLDPAPLHALARASSASLDDLEAVIRARRRVRAAA